MSLDHLLLVRLRAAGIPDGRIRHLHDAALSNSPGLRLAALKFMSDALDAAVTTTSGPEVRGALPITHGVHWIGAGIRLSPDRRLPETIVGTLEGRLMCRVVNVPVIAGHKINEVHTDTTGTTWIWSDPDRISPPRRAGLLRRALYSIQLHLLHARQRGFELSFAALPVNLAAMAIISWGMPALILSRSPAADAAGLPIMLLFGAIGVPIVLAPRFAPVARWEVRFSKQSRLLRARQGWD